ncbi:phosphotransferase [Amaricoccus sp.]|uniref:aminoglycoside phosphotransferase family protein n=1 Tax=Amaricoccus sp. TaxID=1872485 RepID=UPI001B798B31|nr:phosphotransferase [Amaricoccus sp.]MBP7001393.1 phosphotransferase [Amaricoccus sp.]
MSGRAEAIDGFLAAAGWTGAARTPLAGDASARSYVRLARGADRAMLMDVPPESGLVVAPFLAVTDWLRGLGLSAPEVWAADRAAGLVLLEDLGDDLFLRLAARPGREEGLYAAAVDLLADLQAAPLPAATADWAPPPYDRAVLMREMRLVPEWYLPAATGRAVPPDLAAEYDAAVETIVAIALAEPPTAVLRDYHAENLLWLPERVGHARVGLLDYQDLLVGAPAYDLVSLLGDARRDVPPGLAAAMTARYLARTRRKAEGFARSAAALGAQRNLKILGLFVRLAERDGKRGYLRHLPRVWLHLMRDLGHPDLAGVAGFVAAHVPPPAGIA